MTITKNIPKRKINDQNPAQKDDILKKKIINKLSVPLIYKNRKKKTDDNNIIKKIINLVRTAKKILNIIIFVLDQQATQEQIINKIKKILKPSESYEVEILL